MKVNIATLPKVCKEFVIVNQIQQTLNVFFVLALLVVCCFLIVIKVV